MRIIPPSLKPGDRIAVVAPASNIKDALHFKSCHSIISEMGFELTVGDAKWPGDGFLSDHDDARLEEFHAAWSAPDVKAIFALRGGYGSLRILNRIDFSIIRRNPKIFIGFSDITILLNQIFLQTGLICMHGPVLTSLATSDSQSVERAYNCLTGGWHSSLEHQMTIIRKGPTVEAKLLGGNLCSLVTMLGTKYEPDFSEAILFLEDVNEPAYRLDRMLTQLFLSGKLYKIKGIILGDFSNDSHAVENGTCKMHDFVSKRLCELTANSDIPVWGNFPAGHRTKNITLPIGGIAIMESTSGKLNFKAT